MHRAFRVLGVWGLRGARSFSVVGTSGFQVTGEALLPTITINAEDF